MELASLKSRIQQGDYAVEARKVAEAMIEEMRSIRDARAVRPRSRVNPRDLGPLLVAIGGRPQPRP